MEAVQRRKYRSYWAMSSASDSLLTYINMDFDGLGEAAETLLAGNSVDINYRKFKNDLVSFSSKDDVLTLLVHFGYLCYDSEEETVHIPNEEIRMEFADMIRDVTHTETIRRIKESDQLLLDTIDRNEQAVAAQIEKMHMEEYAPRHYNSEQALRSVIKLAYFVYKDHFVQLEELPSGTGIADIIYLPKKRSDFPILLIEVNYSDL